MSSFAGRRELSSSRGHLARGCHGADHPRFGRRDLLQVGGMGLIGVGLADLLRLEAQAAESGARAGKAKSVVFIFQSGGPSQHETFDPKPHAPDMIRGEYGVAQTRIPGELFCEYLPRLAVRSDRFSIVRTMNHIAGREFRNEHNSCMYLMNMADSRRQKPTPPRILPPRSFTVWESAPIASFTIPAAARIASIAVNRFTLYYDYRSEIEPTETNLQIQPGKPMRCDTSPTA